MWGGWTLAGTDLIWPGTPARNGRPLTDGGVHRGEEIGEPGIAQHLVLTIDREDRPVGAKGIEHERGGGELTDSLRQFAADDEPGTQPCHGLIKLSRVYAEDRETGAQARQLVAEHIAVEGGLIGHQDL